MPEIVGMFVLTTVLGLTVSSATATIVGGVILAAGAIGIQLLLAKPGPTPPGAPVLPPPDAGSQALRQTIPSRICGYGRARCAGAYVLFEEKTRVSYDIIVFHHGKVTGIVGYYLHDDVVTIDEDNIVQVLGDDRYQSDSVEIQTRLGLPFETAYSDVITALPEIWTTDHRGDGLASLLLICTSGPLENYHNTYPRGKPEPSVVADLMAIFDPRDETQDRNDSSTWQISNNPVLQLIDYLTNTDYGMGFSYAEMIEPVIELLKVEADICDEEVILADGGTEPRYISNGTFPLDADPANVINTMLDTCDGWLSENGDGTLALKVGLYRQPEFIIKREHIKGFSLQKGVADEELINELTFDYTEQSADYKTAPGQPWRDEASILLLGKVQSQRFALPWVYSHSQGRRLSKRKSLQFNATIRGTITTTLYGLKGLGERWIRIVAPDMIADLSDLIIEARGVTIDLKNATVTFRFVSVNTNEVNAWDASAEEGVRPVIPEKLQAPPPPIPTINSVIGGGVPTDGNAAFLVVWNTPGRSDLSMRTRWRVNGSGSSFTEDPLTYGLAGFVEGSIAAKGGYAITTPAIYEIQAQTFAPSGPGSAWSASVTKQVV